VIKRGKNFYIRLRDLQSVALTQFEGLKNYPVDKVWRVPAFLAKYDPPKIVPVPNILARSSIGSPRARLNFKSTIKPAN
jgi:uncharacterized protein (DUF1684 family)